MDASTLFSQIFSTGSTAAQRLWAQAKAQPGGVFDLPGNAFKQAPEFFKQALHSPHAAKAALDAIQQLSKQWEDATALAAGKFKLPATALLSVQTQYLKSLAALVMEGLSGKVQANADKRFAHAAWQQIVPLGLLAKLYQLNAQTLLNLADAVQASAKTKAQIKFAVQQITDAASPANFLVLNAEAIALAIATKGQSVAHGVQNLLGDLRRGHMSQTDEDQFEVGRNVATTEGAVVFENEFFQLIEYKATTAKIHSRPLLIIPPCINKFYILDLQPANSLVAYAVSQGHRTFVVSWRNADESIAQATFDDYIEHAAIKAIDVVKDISGASQINALGFCVGGTILGTALAVLAERGFKDDKSPVASATFLTTFLDFSETGVLDVFIGENLVKLREAQFAKGGLLKGLELGSTFSFLRPNELVWNYVQGNYYKGETPPAFDLLYWNSDSTNLPGRMYAWYLRNTYLENRLARPRGATVCGHKLDLSKLTLPAYFYGSKEDHIVPIGGAYKSALVTGGDKRFVMGASGHIAGVINAPTANKRSHWVLAQAAAKAPRSKGKTRAELPPTLAHWQAQATEVRGSWWPDWANWLKGHAGAMKAAPKQYGNTRFKTIEPAPGRYVKAKV
jgi:polyhydroxyalkanoate synthase subunit PhaC